MSLLDVEDEHEKHFAIEIDFSSKPKQARQMMNLNALC